MRELRGNERFEILRKLGAGGMGVVYEARDRERDGVRVALKTLKETDAEAVFRFKKEFRVLQDLEHPNLVSFGELIEDQGTWFFSMEFIEGSDFITYVRGGGRRDPKEGPYHEARLRHSLAQLARGLHALHSVGKVHRDVKPSNILVTKEDRLVILDFGLVTDADSGQSWTDLSVVGTSAYMAPEQAASKPVGPEADWYSVGVILYEALTGELPFTGAPLEILMNKQRYEPEPPRSKRPDAPEDLDQLAVGLMRFDPKARPSGRKVLKATHTEEELPHDPSPSMTSFSHSAAFVGRAGELEELRKAYQEVRAGGTGVVFVHGESGIGKTALVRKFADALARDPEEPLVLVGRCYERETVPYKAFDGIVDALARFMVRLPAADAAALLPLRVALLAQIFPVLKRVEAVSQARRGRQEGLDPLEQRTRAFGAMRELLTRLGDRQTLVLTIDDLQWADADSAALLAEILRPPEAPSLLLLATLRPVPERDGPVGDPMLFAEKLPCEVRHLHLDRLGPEQARELADKLIKRAAPEHPLSAESVAKESEGHPLFIDELVRYSVIVGERDAPIRLEDALAARVDSLDPDARRVVQVVAVAAQPLPQSIASQAAGLEATVFNKAVQLLRVSNLVRTSGARGEYSVETLHDRVRQSVVDRLSAEERRAVHERLAIALEGARRSDPEALATHWHGAGDGERAAKYAQAAGARAEEAIAFERAARFYRMALELQDPDAPGLRPLRVKLGDTLAKAGRGADAARYYLAASEGGNAAEALEYQRRAAEQLLRAGHIDEGLAALKKVLAAVGMELPRTSAGALSSFLWSRARLRIRGFKFKERDPSQIPAREQSRIDICWSVASGLGIVDTVRGADFNTRHMILALDSGDPERIGRALGTEIAFTGTLGGRGRARMARLQIFAEEVMARVATPRIRALTRLGTGVAAFLDGSWKRGRELCEEAEAVFRETATDSWWEISSGQFFALFCMAYRGDLGDMLRRQPLCLREAQDRGDLYAEVNLRTGRMALVYLAADDPDRARRESERALGQWSREGFTLQHYYDLLARGQADLYLGESESAMMRLEERWGRLTKALFLRIQHTRIEAFHLRGRIHLAAARGARDESERRGFLGEALRCARTIAREHMPWADPLAALLRAGAASVRGEDDRTRTELEQAVAGLVASDTNLYAAVARRRLGKLIGGDAGAELVTIADQFMLSERVIAPEKMTACLAPGFSS